MKQSFSWWSFAGRGVDTPDLLRGAKSIGYVGVELLPTDLWDAAQDAGLQIVTHGGHASIEHGLNDPRQHDRIAGEIEDTLALTVRHGIPNLIVFSGVRRPGLSDEEGLEHTTAGLRRVAHAAEDAGVTLLLELLNSRRDHIGYQADRTEWGVRVCEAVGSPRVQLLYDIYHMQIMEGDVISTIRSHHAHIAHYHTAGVPGRHELDETQELYYPAICRAIRATGYDGYIGQELIPQGDPLTALQQAYTVCNV